MTQKIKGHNPLEVFAEALTFQEIRMENDANGNPIYIGYASEPELGTAVPSWFIVKITYDGNQSPTRYQLPSAGVLYKYVWDDRATYFN